MKSLHIDEFDIPQQIRNLLWTTGANPRLAKDPSTVVFSIGFDWKTGQFVKPKAKNQFERENLYAEPSLIWSKLPTDTNPPATEPEKQYGITYAKLSPHERYKYLSWLTDITKETDYQYILLFFNGLERHLLLGNYDEAVDLILQLWNFHGKNRSFEYFIPRTLAYASMFRNRPDIINRAPFLLNYSMNPVYVLQQKAGVRINFNQVLDSARSVGFDKIYQIRKGKQRDLFAESLKNRLESFYLEQGSMFDIPKKDLKLVPEPLSSYIQNASLPSDLIKMTCPNFLGSHTFKFLLSNLLNQTYLEVQSLKNKKRPRSKKSTGGQVAGVGSIAKENLPYPYVYYPGSYGAFIGFKQKLDSPMTFCSCSKKAIKNYLRLKTEFSKSFYSTSDKNFILSSSDFPIELVEDFLEQKVESSPSAIDHLIFKDDLCHLCNKATPSLAYTIPMYGGLFKQKYGWYIRRMFYELGVDSFNYLTDVCPPELVPKITEHGTTRDKYITEARNHKISQQFKTSGELSKQRVRINNYVEDRVREQFGFKHVGEAWAGETTLFTIVKKLYPDFEVIHHYRPKYLNGMEFDIFIKEKNLAIEYQGIQHFEAVAHWGGRESLEKGKKRDELKNKIATEEGIKLIYFYYDDDLTEETVLTRLNA